MKLVRVYEQDAQVIWRMQKEAFLPLLEKYRDYDTSPAGETVERVKERLLQPYTYYYLIEEENQIIGAVRVVDHQDGSMKRISPLFVMPAYRRRGYAQAAIREAEKIHGEYGWSLATVEQEAGNCRLYEKMGYRRTEESERINDRMTLIYYEK